MVVGPRLLEGVYSGDGGRALAGGRKTASGDERRSVFRLFGGRSSADKAAVVQKQNHMGCCCSEVFLV